MTVSFRTHNGTIEFQDRDAVLRAFEIEREAQWRAEEFSRKAAADAEALQRALEKTYTVETLAVRLDLSTKSVYHLIHKGKIRYVCAGQKSYRVTELAVREYLGDVPTKK